MPTCAPAGWAATSTRSGRPTTRCKGLSLDVTLQPSLATAKVPVATLQAADQYTFVPPGLTPSPLEASMFQEAANIGAAHANSPDAGLQQAGQIALESHHLASELGNFKYGFTSPVPYPVLD